MGRPRRALRMRPTHQPRSTDQSRPAPYWDWTFTPAPYEPDLDQAHLFNAAAGRATLWAPMHHPAPAPVPF